MLRSAAQPRKAQPQDHEPKKFEDRYEDALKELLKKKQNGEKIEALKESRPSNVVDLMEALRQSVRAENGNSRRKSSPADAAHHRGGTTPRQKKAS
jgi:DNA end-binding protein Ku